MVFRKHLALRKNNFLIGHRWLPYFSEHTGQAECVRVQSKTPIKLNRSKKPSNRTIPRKEWSWENIQKHFWLRNFWRKINKRFTGESWKQFEFEPCYTCEKTSQLSYKSRVLHSIWLCALAGVYTRGGAPAILTILLISVHMSTKICNWRWILHLCSYQDFISKRFQ